MFGLWPLTPAAEWTPERHGPYMLSFQLLYIFTRKELLVFFAPHRLLRVANSVPLVWEKNFPSFAKLLENSSNLRIESKLQSQPTYMAILQFLTGG